VAVFTRFALGKGFWDMDEKNRVRQGDRKKDDDDFVPCPSFEFFLKYYF